MRGGAHQSLFQRGTISTPEWRTSSPRDGGRKVPGAWEGKEWGGKEWEGEKKGRSGDYTQHRGP